MVNDDIMDEFSKEIVSLKITMGISDEELYQILLGCLIAMAISTKRRKGQVVQDLTTHYDKWIKRNRVLH